MENKILELEKKIQEMEKKYNETWDVLSELTYRFINGLGLPTKFINETQELVFDVPKNKNKYLLEHFCEKINEMTEEECEKINEMTEEECEKKLNEFLKEIFEEVIFEKVIGGDMDSPNLMEEQRKILEEKIIAINQGRYYWIFDFDYKAFDIIPENLWSIYDKVKEKKDLEKESLKEKILRPYAEKYIEIHQKIEEQEKDDKLRRIKEKKAELKRLEKEL